MSETIQCPACNMSKPYHFATSRFTSQPVCDECATREAFEGHFWKADAITVAHETRSLETIAREIRRDWKAPYFGAVPYLDAMGQLDRITDNFYQDSGKSIVRYFLSNAAQWRGEAARRVKAELKAMLK